MASIKQQHKLKPTLPQNGNIKRKIETSRTKLEEADETPHPKRKFIKADINLGFCSSYESQLQSLKSLSLTLEEVVHIRKVHTKVELESSLEDPVLYEDIRKGKVCFICKQMRFSFFGQWGVKCKMCERTVCDKCSSKMRFPTEHFAMIPVYMLSPTPSPPPEESSHTFWKFSNVFVFGNSTVNDTSQPTPKLSRQKTTIENGYAAKKRLNFRQSESVYVIPNKKGKTPSVPPPPSRKRPLFQRSKTHVPAESVSAKNNPAHEDKMKGPLAPVCRQCKDMMCNIKNDQIGQFKF